MGILDSVSKLATMFSTPAPVPPTTVTAPSSVPNPANPTVPVTPTAPVTPPTPLDAHQKLWQNDPKNAPKPPEPIVNLDPKVMLDAAQKLDFRSSVTPEITARIKAGGDDGVAATLEALNAVAQQAFANNVAASATIVDEALKKQQQQFQAELPKLIKQHNLRSAGLENPVLSNPAVKPIVNAVVKQIQAKNPDASEAEIRKLSSDYFDGLGEMLSAHKTANDPKAPKTGVPKDQDFSDWA